MRPGRVPAPLGRALGSAAQPAPICSSAREAAELVSPLRLPGRQPPRTAPLLNGTAEPRPPTAQAPRMRRPSCRGEKACRGARRRGPGRFAKAILQVRELRGAEPWAALLFCRQLLLGLFKDAPRVAESRSFLLCFGAVLQFCSFQLL